MRTVEVSWQPEESRFTATGSARGQVVSIRAPRAVGAPDLSVGERAPDDRPAETGFSATELPLAGAGACVLWDVVETLRKQRQDVTGLEVRVEGVQDPDPPWAYRNITLHVTARGHALDRRRLARAVRLAVDRYCSVLATVRGVSEVQHAIEVVDEVNEPATA